MRLVKTLDVFNRIEIAPFQDAEALAYAGLTAEQGGTAAWLVLPNGARYRGAGAVWAAFAAMWPIMGDILLAIYHLPGIRALQDAAYRFVANNRRHIPSGKAYLDGK